MKKPLQPRIEVLTEQKEWLLFKDFLGENPEQEWQEAIKETCNLNTKNKRYRAVIDIGYGLTSIYCDGFYTVPTIRFY